MLDLKLLRNDPERVRRAIETKGESADLDALLALDERRRTILQDVERKKAERNRASEQIAGLKRSGEDASAQIASARRLGEEIKQLDEELRRVEADLDDGLLWIPNLPHETVPIGPDADSNVEIRRWGTIPPETFRPANHWEIGSELGLFDLERASRVSGSGFVFYTGLGALLQRALIQMMLDRHTREGDYQEISAPYLVRGESLEGTGQLPKLAEDMYRTGEDALYLIPTAEVPITNLFRGEILDAADLPRRYVGYTACFRREAGAAGRDTRGLVRVHQFDKVELVKFVRPETSYDELEALVGDAEAILQALEIPYRVLSLATGDLSFAAAKCYDLEAWAPAEQRWLEVSSCSNFEDFQARRIGVRYRDEEGKVRYVHTLNGSGLALPRVIAAMLELFQTERGGVRVPEALRPYLGGREELAAP
ncbi:MAG: serine--tRNA ligase [Candidatus Eisenbacteria bacterium]|nr:serine--tRNA ligase [Candidatus Latescibacterota bacterium]MBD3301573.1 serine--tRNA ligase [Candidatus Eisenbacteria bacterium]